MKTHRPLPSRRRAHIWSPALLLVCTLGAPALAQRPAASRPAADASPRPTAASPAPAAAPIRVLWLADGQGWDFRYVRAILERTEDIDLQVSLGVPADPVAARADLDKIDVLLISDLSLGRGGPRPRTPLDVMGVLARGAGVGFVSGVPVPAALRSQVLDRLLPVRLLPERHPPAERIPAQLLPPADRPLHPILRLGDDEAPQAVFAQLPVVRYVATVQELAPHAEVLLADPLHLVGGQPGIVAAVGRWQQGRTAWVGTDETWSWRTPHGDVYQAAFWRNLVRHLAGRL